MKKTKWADTKTNAQNMGFRLVLICLATILPASLSWADGLFYRLPNDGTWARYSIAMRSSAGDSLCTGRLYIASVGQIVERGQAYRWIEVQLEPIAQPGQPKEIYRLLIPDKQLVAGGSPFMYILRAQFRMEVIGEDAAGDLYQEQETTDHNDLRSSGLPIIFSGPFENVKRLEEIILDSKLGKVACAGVCGIVHVDDRHGKCREKYDVESRLHPKSPFGIVSSHWKNINGNDGGEIIFTLTDYGEGATSKIKGTGKNQAPSTQKYYADNQTLAAGKCCMLKARAFRGHKIRFRRCFQFGRHRRSWCRSSDNRAIYHSLNEEGECCKE